MRSPDFGIVAGLAILVLLCASLPYMSIPTGLVIGFLESYDDFTFYYLDEILIFGEYQNKGYGRLLLQEVEQRVRERGAQMIELVCPDDAHHMHFYGGFGMAEATNLKLMKKRL